MSKVFACTDSPRCAISLQNCNGNCCNFVTFVALVAANILGVTNGISPTLLGGINLSILGISFATNVVRLDIIQAIVAAAFISINILMLQGTLSMYTASWIHLGSVAVAAILSSTIST